MGSPYLTGGYLLRCGRLLWSGGSGSLGSGGLLTGFLGVGGLLVKSSELVYPPAGALDTAWA